MKTFLQITQGLKINKLYRSLSKQEKRGCVKLDLMIAIDFKKLKQIDEPLKSVW